MLCCHFWHCNKIHRKLSDSLDLALLPSSHFKENHKSEDAGLVAGSIQKHFEPKPRFSLKPWTAGATPPLSLTLHPIMQDVLNPSVR